MTFFEHLTPAGTAGLGVLAAGAAVSYASGFFARRFDLSAKGRTGVQMAGLTAAAAGCLMVLIG